MDPEEKRATLKFLGLGKERPIYLGRWCVLWGVGPAMNQEWSGVGTGIPGYILYKGAGQVSSLRTSWAG